LSSPIYNSDSFHAFKLNRLFVWLDLTYINNYIFILFAEELKEHFVQYGEITNISLKTDPATGRSRGFAFIIFKSVDGLNNVKLHFYCIFT